MAETCDLSEDSQIESIQSPKVVFEDLELRNAYESCFNNNKSTAVECLEEGRPAKRLRLSEAIQVRNRFDDTSFLASELSRLLSIKLPHGITSLHETAAYAMFFLARRSHAYKSREPFSRLSESDQCSVLLVIGRIACTHDERLINTMGIVEKHELLEQCLICERPESPNNRKPTSGENDDVDLLPVLKSLLDVPQMHKKRRLGVIAMLTLKRLLSHTRDEKSLSLMTSTYGQWCLQSLQNPARDLRIAAGFVLSCPFLLFLTNASRTLSVFLRAPHEPSVLQDNRRGALEFLRNLSASGPATFQETAIFAWGEVAV